MDNKETIFPLFPTPILSSELTDSIVSEATLLLDKENIKIKSQAGGGYYGEVSSDTYILDKEIYKPLRSIILEKVQYYCNDILGYGYKQYLTTQSWLSIKYPNQSHTKHFHPHSLISGVLFFGETSENTSSLMFHRTDNFIRSYVGNKYNKNLDQKYRQFTSQTFSLKHTPNFLILFPSSLEHSVPLNTSNIPRKSLAFNIAPVGGFGSEGDLTELKFN